MVEPVAHRCEGCRETERLKEHVREQGEGGGDVRGVYVVLRPYDPSRPDGTDFGRLDA